MELRQKFDGLAAAIASWMHGRAAHGRSHPGDTDRGCEQASTAAIGESPMPRALAALLLLTAVTMLAFVTASVIVKGFAGKNPTRLTLASVEQMASAEYRKARARCQQLAGVARDACIAEAHAAEGRARAVVLMGGAQQSSYLSKLRARTDAAIDAGDRDAIIVEPACNIVARGQGSLCEIQPKQDAVGTNLIPATMNAEQYAAAFPLKSRMQRQLPLIAAQQVQPSTRMAAMQPPPRASEMERIFQLAWSARQ